VNEPVAKGKKGESQGERKYRGRFGPGPTSRVHKKVSLKGKSFRIDGRVSGEET